MAWDGGNAQQVATKPKAKASSLENVVSGSVV